jgi:hypothetical protein
MRATLKQEIFIMVTGGEDLRMALSIAGVLAT